MTEHDKIAEARPSKRDAKAAAECFGGIWTEDGWVSCLAQVQANIERALAAARAQGAAEAFEKAAAEVERTRASWTDDPTADEALEMARNLVLALAREAAK